MKKFTHKCGARLTIGAWKHCPQCRGELHGISDRKRPASSCSWFVRVWKCVFLRRKKWKIAKALSHAAVVASEIGKEELYFDLEEASDEVWREVYLEENAESDAEESAPES